MTRPRPYRILGLLLLLLAPSAWAQGGFSGSGTISGSGITRIFPPPTVTVSPASLAFGSIQQGSSSASQPVTVTNTSVSGLAISSIVTSAQYSLTTTCPATLGAGLTCTISVTFSPTSTGLVNGTLTITDSAATSPQTVSLSGTGTSVGPPIASLTPASLSFGNITQGSSSGALPAILQNTGGTNLTISSIAVSAQYSQTNNCPAALVPTASCTINVTFSPTSLGLVSGTLTVTDNAAGSPHVSNLSGTGVAASACGGNPSLLCAVGWQQIPNTHVRSFCPPYADIQLNTGCPAVMTAWSGALWDSRRSLFVIHGGGHNDYGGNELYKVDMNTSPIAMSLMHDASTGAGIANIGTCPLALSDGSQNARHPYAGEIFIDNLDVYQFWSGAKSTCGFFSNDMWYYDPLAPITPAAAAWTELQPTNPGTGPNEGGEGSIPAMAYDPGSETHPPLTYNYATNDGFYLSFNRVTNAWNLNANVGNPVNASCGGQTDFNVFLDPTRRFFFATCNGGKAGRWLLDSPYTATVMNMTGCTPLGVNSPGVAFDPVHKDFVMWGGGNTVYFYNPDTDSCTNQTFAGGPTTIQANGTFGRLQWDAKDGGFLLVNDIDSNVYFFRRDTTATLQSMEWTARSTAAGVLRADNFSDPTLFTNQSQTNVNGVHQAPGGLQPSRDCTTWTSPSGCSAKFFVPAQNGGNAAGEYYVLFGPNGGETHIDGTAGKQDIYFSVVQKYDANLLNQHPKASGGGVTFFKQWIVAVPGNTCQAQELTTVNLNDNGYPGTYTDCGQIGFQPAIAGADFLLEQGDNCLSSYGAANSCTAAAVNTGYDCHYQVVNNNNRSCALYPPGQWVNYYCHYHIGAFGTPTSSYACWQQVPGTAFRQYLNIKNFNMGTSAGNSGYFSFIDLLAYFTNRDGNTAFGQNGNTWTSEVIISTQPIAGKFAPVN